MNILELASKVTNGGKRKIKMSLLEIHNTGQANKNGIHWEEQYILDNLDSIKNMPICAEFLSEDKEVPYGHGFSGIEDGSPQFCDSEVVGSMEYPQIEEFEINDEINNVLCGYGYIY